MERSRLAPPVSDIAAQAATSLLCDQVRHMGSITKLSKPQKRRRRLQRQAVRQSILDTQKVKEACGLVELKTKDCKTASGYAESHDVEAALPLQRLEAKVDRLQQVLNDLLWHICSGATWQGNGNLNIVLNESVVGDADTAGTSLPKTLNPEASPFMPAYPDIHLNEYEGVEKDHESERGNEFTYDQEECAVFLNGDLKFAANAAEAPSKRSIATDSNMDTTSAVPSASGSLDQTSDIGAMLQTSSCLDVQVHSRVTIRKGLWRGRTGVVTRFGPALDCDELMCQICLDDDGRMIYSMPCDLDCVAHRINVAESSKTSVPASREENILADKCTDEPNATTASDEDLTQDARKDLENIIRKSMVILDTGRVPERCTNLWLPLLQRAQSTLAAQGTEDECTLMRSILSDRLAQIADEIFSAVTAQAIPEQPAQHNRTSR